MQTPLFLVKEQSLREGHIQGQLPIDYPRADTSCLVREPDIQQTKKMPQRSDVNGLDCAASLPECSLLGKRTLNNSVLRRSKHSRWWRRDGALMDYITTVRLNNGAEQLSLCEEGSDP